MICIFMIYGRIQPLNTEVGFPFWPDQLATQSPQETLVLPIPHKASREVSDCGESCVLMSKKTQRISPQDDSLRANVLGMKGF